ncbi:hypothetical protein GCM10022224_069140 [Nonomuraea antimicrobica]|uniref:RNA polymerase sigma-70 region 2 domain-containing protein n=1 Tax=Nonomuraea antimicrobica TaxID=561173 RepID=A0ABP7CS76_9ACTN
MTARIPPEIADQVGRLYVQAASALFRYACKLPQVDRAHAEDLVHIAFQEAALCWDELAARDLEGRRRWLFAVLRNKAIDEWRRNRRQQPCADLPEPVHPAAEPSTRSCPRWRCGGAGRPSSRCRRCGSASPSYAGTSSGPLAR